mgnify:CR=1 FL=1
MIDELIADVEALGQEQVDVVLPAPEPLSTSTAGLACPHCDSLDTAVQEVEDAEVPLSGGEKNRVLLARMLCEGGNVLVLDEPTNDLDLETLDLLQETYQFQETTRSQKSFLLSASVLLRAFLGMIDPLEGGIALVFGALLGLGAWLVSRVPVPKFTWISLAVSIGLGTLTLLAAIFLRDPVSVDSVTGEATATNPLATVPIAIALLWAYRLSVLVTLAGAITYVVKIARAVAGIEERAPAGSRRGWIALVIAGVALLAAAGVAGTAPSALAA